MPESIVTKPLVKWLSRRCSAVFCFLSCLGQSCLDHCWPRIGSLWLRAISRFILSSARETSSVTCAILMLLNMSLSFAGIPSLLAIASLSVTALPITLRLAPHDRQNFRSGVDSVAHWGQNMIVHRFAEHYPAVFAVSKAISTTLSGCGWFSQMPATFIEDVLRPVDLTFGFFLCPLRSRATSLTRSSLFDKKRYKF